MSNTVALYRDEQAVLKHLYELIIFLDHHHIKREIDSGILNRLIRLRDEFARINHKLEIAFQEKKEMGQDYFENSSLKEKMEEMYSLIDEQLKKIQVKLPNRKSHLLEEFSLFKKELSLKYEDCLNQNSLEFIHLPHLRPRNVKRNIFHMLSGIIVLFLVNYLVPQVYLVHLACVFFVLAWGLDLGRKKYPMFQQFAMFLFKGVKHPHETYRINSATWYTTALLILATFFDLTSINCAIIILAFSDPAAALIGRKYGKIKILHGRTLEGSLTFFLTAFVSSSLIITAFGNQFYFEHLFKVAFLTSFIAAITELVSHKVDDNLTIPLSAAIGVSFASYLFI